MNATPITHRGFRETITAAFLDPNCLQPYSPLLPLSVLLIDNVTTHTPLISHIKGIFIFSIIYTPRSMCRKEHRPNIPSLTFVLNKV